MNERKHRRGANGDQARLKRHIGRQVARKLEARRHQHKALWLGFSVTGLVGWGVVISSLAGLGVGVWIDAQYPRMFSWTLMLFALGLILGCLNGWYWMSRELAEIRREQEEKHGTPDKENQPHE
jgi:ATP synthase protein I